MSIEDAIRAIVREELQALLAGDPRERSAVKIDDVARARARAALKRAGVVLPPAEESRPGRRSR